MSARGMGVSWGLAGFRIGRSPTGSLWVSFTVPGTGVSFFKYLPLKSSQRHSSVTPQPPTQALPHAPSAPLTANQRVLEEIHRSKP